MIRFFAYPFEISQPPPLTVSVLWFFGTPPVNTIIASEFAFDILLSSFQNDAPNQDSCIELHLDWRIAQSNDGIVGSLNSPHPQTLWQVFLTRGRLLQNTFDVLLYLVQAFQLPCAYSIHFHCLHRCQTKICVDDVRQRQCLFKQLNKVLHALVVDPSVRCRDQQVIRNARSSRGVSNNRLVTISMLFWWF